MDPRFRKVSYSVEMPLSAIFCAVVAWLSLVSGAVMAGIAMAETGYGKPDQTGLFISSMAAILGSALWFALTRIIMLLAQIAENTRQPSLIGEPPALQGEGKIV